MRRTLMVGLFGLATLLTALPATGLSLEAPLPPMGPASNPVSVEICFPIGVYVGDIVLDVDDDQIYFPCPRHEGGA